MAVCLVFKRFVLLLMLTAVVAHPCRNNWRGPKCEYCGPNGDFFRDCICYPEFTGPNCTQCSNRWQGSLCTECPPRFEKRECRVCMSGYAGANCTECAVNFVKRGNDCVSITPPPTFRIGNSFYTMAPPRTLPQGYVNAMSRDMRDRRHHLPRGINITAGAALQFRRVVSSLSQNQNAMVAFAMMGLGIIALAVAVYRHRNKHSQADQSLSVPMVSSTSTYGTIA
jgi:hypothetical protein